MDYLLHVLILITIFAMLAISLDLLVGHIGLMSIAHAGFYGIGAYTSAILAVDHGIGFLLSTLIAMFVAALVSLIIALSSLRFHDDYFVIATFGFQIILFSIFNNWIGLTGGPLGIPKIPIPSILGWQFASHASFLALSLACALFAFVVVDRLASGPFGRVLHAIRENEVLAHSLGKNTLYYKVVASGMSAALAALAGSLYAGYITYIDPTSFTIMESILIISMVIIGGAGSMWGPVIGAIVLVALPEVLRFTGVPSGIAANVRQITYGTMLVLMLLYRPGGLVGRYSFGK